MTLSCEDANPKLVEVVTVADVDDEGQMRKLKFRQDFEVEVWSVFCC